MGAVPQCGDVNVIKIFLGPAMDTSKATAIWALKIRDFQGPPLQNCPSNEFAPIKILSSSAI
jgi:hypothetical protein